MKNNQAKKKLDVVPIHIVAIVEAFLFEQNSPVKIDKISDVVDYSNWMVKEALEKLKSNYDDKTKGIKITKTNKGYEFVQREKYRNIISKKKQKNNDQLTTIVDEFLYVLESRGNREGTIDSYRINLNRFIKFLGKEIENITRKDIRSYLMNEKKRGNARSTIATKVSIIKSFFNWLHDEELIESNSAKKIEKPKETKSDPKYLTHEEIEKLRETCNTIKDRVLVETLYSSGIRVSEAVSLNWQNIDFSNQKIEIIDGKGGKDRITLLSTKAIMLLKKYREQRDGDKEWVFQTKWRGLNRMSKETIERRIKKLGKQANISKKVTPHRLRHSFATHLLESGLSIDKVQMLLGHSNVSTTQIYAKTNQLDIEHSYRKVFH